MKMSEAHFLPQWLEYRDTHVRPAREAFDARVAEGAGDDEVDEAARAYFQALGEYRQRIDNSPGGALSAGDGSAAMGALFTGARELYTEINAETKRIDSIVGPNFPIEG